MVTIDLTDERKPQWRPNWHFWVKIIAVCIFIWLILLMARVKTETTPLSIAQSQIGHGEIGGNNKGYYIRQYLNGQEGLPWCAGFVSYCIRKSGLNLRYTLRAKDYLKIGKIVNNPQAGDLIIFSRQGGGHIGIIEKVTKDTIDTIEGNLGAYPSRVKRVIYKKNNIKNLLGYVKLERGRNK